MDMPQLTKIERLLVAAVRVYRTILKLRNDRAGLADSIMEARRGHVVHYLNPPADAMRNVSLRTPTLHPT